MKNTIVIAALAITAGHAAHAAAQHKGKQHIRRQHPTSNGSFLRTMVYSVPDLIDQIGSNPAIAARYARHYHRPAADVVKYLRANVVESYIPHTQVIRTYWVRHNGSITAKQERMERGVRVFALRNGEPVLKWACGNPLTTSLPYVKTTVAHKSPKPIEHLLPSTEVLVPAEPPDIIIPSESPAPPVVAAEPPAVNFSHQAEPAAPHLGFPIGALIPIAAIPIIIATTNHPTENPLGPQPTPEAPTTVAFAGLTVLGLAAARRRRV